MGMGVSKTEGERVALAISNISDLNRVCKVLDPRLLVQEPAIPQQIPPPDTTDPGILTIGRKYGAEYVLTSQVSQLGRQRVIILTVVEVSSGRLVTGGYREIREIRDVDMLVPNIVRNMVQVIAQDTGKAPNLGVSPLTVSPLIRSTVEDITVLGYLLFIELANTGKYKVMRRLSGDRTEGVRNLGALLKAPYILKVNVTPLDDRNRVLAQIIELEENTDSVFRGGAVQYRNIGDGIQLMSDLAYQLTDVRDRGMPNIFVPENMVWVAGGTFRMGSQVYNGDENPVHMVQVNSFFMSKTQVTQEEYSRVMGTNPSRFQNPGAPVERITWYEAIEYCNKLSQREGLIPAYSGNNDRIIWDSSANGYRLPTEAEWEYAAQGGNVETLNFNLPGGNGGDGLAWYKGNSGGITHRVATKTANILGLYDMAGNVWEWCWDRYGPYDEKTQYNPRGPGLGLNRVVRGGSWNSEEAELRLTYRHIGNPEQRYSDVGFRVVRPRF
jgi:formylglycine-generating enzyme required for sulfatase activity/TolB-like protein